MDDELHVKIADFGLTRVSDATNTQSGAFHCNFAAPELFGPPELDADVPPAPRTQNSDVFAFGCLYYEVRHNKSTRVLVAELLPRSIMAVCHLLI